VYLFGFITKKFVTMPGHTNVKFLKYITVIVPNIFSELIS